MRTRRLARLLALPLAALALAVPTAAAAAGATSDTTTEHGATETFVDVFPCLGDAPYQITLTYNSVEHTTTLPNGTVHVTGTETGTVAAVPVDDATLPSFSGRFTEWFGFNANRANQAGTFTFTVHAAGSDGSSVAFHETAHESVSATGTTVSFDKPSC